ncbi:HmuY protein [compost metagenome]
MKETTYKTLDITKDATYNFGFVSLADGKAVTVEPEKAKWDITWTWSLYYGGTGAGAYPYGFSDVIFINTLGGTQAAEVLETAISYEAFSENDVAATPFSNARNTIGDKWRSTSPATGIKTDRFYVIKDAAGNVYKLKFISMGVGGDGGERGKPVIEYKLVKKA